MLGGILGLGCRVRVSLTRLCRGGSCGGIVGQEEGHGLMLLSKRS